jgi:hypothetical protein
MSANPSSSCDAAKPLLPPTADLRLDSNSPAPSVVDGLSAEKAVGDAEEAIRRIDIPLLPPTADLPMESDPPVLSVVDNGGDTSPAEKSVRQAEKALGEIDIHDTWEKQLRRYSG